MIDLDKVEQISKIVSYLAIPVILAIGGWIFQTQLQNKQVQAQEIGLALQVLDKQILIEDGNPVIHPLRYWAASVISEKANLNLSVTEHTMLAQWPHQSKIAWEYKSNEAMLLGRYEEPKHALLQKVFEGIYLDATRFAITLNEACKPQSVNVFEHDKNDLGKSYFNLNTAIINKPDVERASDNPTNTP